MNIYNTKVQQASAVKAQNANRTASVTPVPNTTHPASTIVPAPITPQVPSNENPEPAEP